MPKHFTYATQVQLFHAAAEQLMSFTLSTQTDFNLYYYYVSCI